MIPNPSSHAPGTLFARPYDPGREYDGFLADAWSLGIILYALFTGTVPFDSPNVTTLLRLIIKGAFRVPEGLDEDVKSLVERLIVTDPLRRMQARSLCLGTFFVSCAAQPAPSLLSTPSLRRLLHLLCSLHFINSRLRFRTQVRDILKHPVFRPLHECRAQAPLPGCCLERMVGQEECREDSTGTV
jgi:serine/threonine protein kinase